MKALISRLLYTREFRNSLWGAMARGLIRRTAKRMKYSVDFQVDMLAVDRPHYAWCMLGAARLAKRLGHDRISAIEFGVAGGNGLAYMCDFARDVERVTGVKVDCYGFETGQGMPEPEGPYDLPYWFAASQYKMDRAALEARVPEAHLVLGDIDETIDGFLESHKPAPIGVIFNDTDYHSSTRDSFRIFRQVKNRPEHFLPRIFMYFDDVLGSEFEMYAEHNGQLRAIAELNAEQKAIRIHRNQNLIHQDYLPYRHQIYYGHLFDHPNYNTYIGEGRQEAIEDRLKLRT
ncbi:hypothetical protein SAMN04490248_11926 [Salinihabitans flavidus]|uniref:Methyltransferase domain-containing protein n=1 Tax=Salinihabitans flavidus TaxID=569882 RepID=A0A1H8UB24_9RHOB|nr:hypothetical protein [Salinihabitans flavidus]SEP00440.1 hypothetical protein SAMN04490248_11926 [Salinihabitans flavidus]